MIRSCRRRDSANSSSLPKPSSASASEWRRSANSAVARCSSAGPSVQMAAATAVSCPLSRHQPQGVQRLAGGPQTGVRRLVQRHDAVAIGGVEQVLALDQIECVASITIALRKRTRSARVRRDVATQAAAADRRHGAALLRQLPYLRAAVYMARTFSTGVSCGRPKAASRISLPPL